MIWPYLVGGAAAILILDHTLNAKYKTGARPSRFVSEREARNLHQAARAGNLATLRSLLDRGVSPDHLDDSGATALHHAAEAQQVEAARLLLDCGARTDLRAQIQRVDFNAQRVEMTGQGNTPLIIAAVRGDAALTELLLSRGADVDVRNRDGGTALFMAAQRGHLEVVRALLAAKADPSKGSAKGVTPLQIAVESGHEKVAALLRETGGAAR